MTIRNSVAAAALLAAALATATRGDDPDATVRFTVDGGDPRILVAAPSSNTDGLLRYAGALSQGDVDVTWSLDVRPDPSQDAPIMGSIDFTNGSAAPTDVEFSFDVPVCPTVVDASLIGGFVTLRLVTDDDGGQLSMSEGDAVWSLMIDGAQAAGLFEGPFLLSVSGAGTSTTSTNFGAPFPSADGPAISDSTGVRLAFNLTAGEVAEFGTMAFAGADAAHLVSCDGSLGEGEGDAFGRTVASIGDVDGDGCIDFAVGAPFNDDGGADAGKVYIVSGCTLAVIASRAGASAGDRFGTAVAGAGDVDGDGIGDIAVGAPHNSEAGGRAGAIYVLSGADASIIMTRFGAVAGGRLGWSVAGGIDVDNDGTPDVIAGAPFDATVASNAGSAIVWSGATGAVLATHRGDAAGDRFGWAVAAVGRMNANGFLDYAIGAPWHDAAGSNAGMVRAFDGAGHAVLFTLTGAAAGDQFGRAVAGAGRVDGDPRDDLVVGSPFAVRAGMPKVGRIDVYSGASGNLLWTRRGWNQGDRLGWSVSCAGDVDGDGFDDVASGAPWHDATGANAGRVTVRSGADGSLIATIDGDAASDLFGWSVAPAGNIDGAGNDDLLVGAPGDDTAAQNAGSAVQLHFSGAGALEAVEAVSDPAERDYDLNGDGAVDSADVLPLLAAWGACASCAEDLDGDGIVDETDLALLVGAIE